MPNKYHWGMVKRLKKPLVLAVSAGKSVVKKVVKLLPNAGVAPKMRKNLKWEIRKTRRRQI